MPNPAPSESQGYRWATGGDVNAFFGLMLDNIADLVLAVSLLHLAYGFPVEFALQHMVPGTAIGVLFGDLVFSGMAFLLARKTGRSDVTAMPLGLDTPSTFGMVFFVLGPAFQAAQRQGLTVEEAARFTWHIGICAIVASGIFKILCAFVSGWIRKLVPRAGLLGSLTAIALVLISFLPLLDIFHLPIIGMISLAIILTTLIAKVPFPGKIPGALVSLVVGGALFYTLKALGWIDVPHESIEPHIWFPTNWLEAWKFEWVADWKSSLQYLPIVIPFALATVVGGIDCTESAAAAGDEYHTGSIIAVEGLATLLAGLCGGVIQSTPYIGHPAYKAMGGRAGYTLATAIFIGSAGLIGYFGIMYEWIPRPAVFPILIFVGLEITSQSFHATPHRHYPAVAISCLPALAYLVMLFADNILVQTGGKTVDQLAPPLGDQLQTMRMLSSGFIVTSLLWASALAALVDKRLYVAAAFFGVAAFCSFFGVIHSPLAQSPLALPWLLEDVPKAARYQTPYWMAGSYLAMSAMLVLWQMWTDRSVEEDDSPKPKREPKPAKNQDAKK